MQVTINVDDDMLQAARELARQRSDTLSQVFSDFARTALSPPPRPRFRNGVPLFESIPGGPHATLELVNQLLDEE